MQIAGNVHGPSFIQGRLRGLVEQWKEASENTPESEDAYENGRADQREWCAEDLEKVLKELFGD